MFIPLIHLLFISFWAKILFFSILMYVFVQKRGTSDRPIYTIGCSVLSRVSSNAPIYSIGSSVVSRWTVLSLLCTFKNHKIYRLPQLPLHFSPFHLGDSRLFIFLGVFSSILRLHFAFNLLHSRYFLLFYLSCEFYHYSLKCSLAFGYFCFNFEVLMCFSCESA